MIEMFLGDKTLDDQEVEEVSERILEDVRGVFDTTTNLMLIDMDDTNNRFRQNLRHIIFFITFVIYSLLG